jgi:type II secretory pathway pseudopilin PulG
MELLVVIAILVILAALLFPVAAVVGERARRTACHSNLRQLGLAWNMYADDYDETYFWQARWDEEVDVVHWGIHYRTFVRWPFALYPYLRSEAIYRCPSDPAPENWRVWAPDTKWYLSYGPNLMIAMGYPAGVGGAPRTRGSIDDPGKVIALAESITGYGCCETWNLAYHRCANYHGYGWDWYTFRDKCDRARQYHLTDDDMRLYTRHSLGNNAVMLDGRVRWLRWDKVGDADSEEWKRMLGVIQ